MSLLLGQRALGATAAPAAARRRCVIARFANDPSGTSGTKAKIQFTLPHHVEFGQEVAVVGEADALGKWDATAAVPMSWTDGDIWTATAEVPIGGAVEYKYILRAADSGEVIEWQPCGNLKIELPEAPAGSVIVKDAWEGELHELTISEGASAPAPAAPAAAAPAAPTPAPKAAAETKAAAKPKAAVEEEEVKPKAAPVPAPTPASSKSPIVAAAATEEVPPPAPTPKTTSPKPTSGRPSTSSKAPKGGRRSA